MRKNVRNFFGNLFGFSKEITDLQRKAEYEQSRRQGAEETIQRTLNVLETSINARVKDKKIAALLSEAAKNVAQGSQLPESGWSSWDHYCHAGQLEGEYIQLSKRIIETFGISGEEAKGGEEK